MMDAAYLSAVAALAGSAIGGLTSLGTSWLTQRVQVTAERLAHELSRREELYKDFIDEASIAFADALERSEPDVAKLVRLYALVSRMRVLSSERVVEQADAVMRTIMETYHAPNTSLREVAEAAEPSTLDPLRSFSDACRAERRQVVTGIVSHEKTTGRGGYEKRAGIGACRTIRADMLVERRILSGSESALNTPRGEAAMAIFDDTRSAARHS